MSLVGKLEDLGLGEILQIVSLSRKSGVLTLQSRGREGKIVFRQGQVIRAASSLHRENVGDLLLRRGVVDMETLRSALLRQKQDVLHSRLGGILVEHFGVNAAKIEEIVREHVEQVVYGLFGWEDGAFSFELGEPEELGATSFSPLQFMLEQGLNPQWLAMEGSRLLDERRHRGDFHDESSAEPNPETEALLAEYHAADAGTAASSPPQPDVLLVDDDPLTGRELARMLNESGYATTVFTGGRDFLSAVDAAVAADQRPVLLIDLIMPRTDGSGILGGFELLEQVRDRFPRLPVLLLSDHPNEEAERRARQLGVLGVLAKPKGMELRAVEGARQLQETARKVAALVGEVRAAVASAVPLVDIGAELMREFGEEGGRPLTQFSASPGLHLLRGMLQELNNPALGGGITLLVLRFASELMNRAVIFLVKEREIVGLGQFGIGTNSEQADARIRRMKIPLGEDSVFRPVLQAMVPMRLRPGDVPWDRYLRQQLGGDLPEEIFLGPIVREGKVVAVLYGDNVPDRRPIGDTEALEIFLSQAGLAMEKALLEKRLHGREAV
jgi:CheY-like chemotaxis protein